MELGNAKVEISLNDFQALQNKITSLEAELTDANKAIDDAKLGEHGSEARAYRDAFLAALKIAQFGIGNLDPLTVRGWPYDALYELADHMRARPGLDGFQREIVGDLRIFADNCKRWEDARAKGIEKELLADENAAHGPVPTA